MNRGWQVEHSCPQCGAPVVLDETDHLMPCPYCRVCCYMVSREAHRYYIPPSKEALERRADDIFFLPYWRLKGVLYACPPFKVESHILDATILSVQVEKAPFSLGLRPQVLKLKFVNKNAPGLFEEPEFDFDRAMAGIMDRFKLIGGKNNREESFYNTFLSETRSLIFAPFLVSGGSLIDAVTNKVLGPRPDRKKLDATPAKDTLWEVKFIPAVCPYCGWDLKGDSGALVMVCRNCGQASAATSQGLLQVKYGLVEGKTGDLYLPFWRIKAEAEGIELNSFGDFIRVANLPRVVTRQTLEQELHFWAPAFRGSPHLYLRCCRNVTVAQPKTVVREEPGVTNPAPVTHSFEDAAGGLKMFLAHITMAKRKLFPELPSITLKPVDHTLVYLPFHQVGQEMVNTDVQLSISRVILGLEGETV